MRGHAAAKQKMGVENSALWSRSIAVRQVSLSLFHLTHLLRAGVGLDEALSELQQLEGDARLRRVWADVTRQLRAGRTLAMAMNRWPNTFDPVVRALVSASELDGDLSTACQACHHHMEWMHRTRSGMLTSLVYPLFALLALIAVTAFLLISVVPELSNFLKSSGRDLSWHSQALLQLSSNLSRGWVSILCIPAFVTALVWLLRSSSMTMRAILDRWVLVLPVLGHVILFLNLSRYAGIGGRLQDNGVTLERTLRASESAIANLALQQCFSRVRRTVTGGSTLASALAAEPLLPSSFRRLLSAGESTGALGQAMSQAAEQHQYHVQHYLQRLERLLGPVTLMLVGLVLMWIVLSLLAPVYESAIDSVLLS